MNWRTRVRATLFALLVALALLPGCASMHQHCTYYPDGVLENYGSHATVVGAGETEMVTTDCAGLAYSTKDTGISDNGKESVLGLAAEAGDVFSAGGQAGSLLDEFRDE